MLMKNSIVLVLVLFLQLMLVGCFLGDRQPLNRTVSLNFPDPQGRNVVQLSLHDAGVQDALRVIDAVLSTNGFIRELNPDMANVPDFVASYVRIESTGLRLGILPNVYLRHGQLDVVIVELGNRTTQPNALTRQICKSLRTELGRFYGDKRVKVK